MEIPMAEIARHVGYVDQLSLRQFKRWNQRIRFIDFINVPIFPNLRSRILHDGTTDADLNQKSREVETVVRRVIASRAALNLRVS
jgi:hypothetical protein